MSDPVRESFERLRREALARQETAAECAVSKLEDRLEDAELRWDETRLREAISPVIAAAIRDAGRVQPEAVARAVAPHIVGTVRTEIKNSEEAIIDVLHPRLGRLIRRGISSAVSDLQRQVDSALPFDRWMASITSRLSGASALGVLLKDAEPFIIHEAFLIERRSGRLLAREAPENSADADRADDDLVAGMIAALDSFASDALAAGGAGTLRRVETDAGSLYVRASATRIIALRTSGAAQPDIEHRLDLLLESLLEQTGEDGLSVQTFNTTPLLMEEDGGASDEAKAAGGGAFALISKVVGGIAAAFLALWSHGAIEEHRIDRAVAAVASVTANAEPYRGYPLVVAVEPDGVAIGVRGLAPDEAARAELLESLANVPSVLPLRIEIAIAGRRLSP